MDSFFKVFAIISDFAGIIGAIISVFIWFKIKKQTKELIKLAGQKNNADQGFAEMVEYHSKINSAKPYAFCVSLTDNIISIKQDVEGFLRIKNMEMPIEELNRSGLTHENFPDFVAELKEKRRVLNGKGATEIHLFISGLMQAALMIGVVFGNWIPVKMYNFSAGLRSYEYWCPLVK